VKTPQNDRREDEELQRIAGEKDDAGMKFDATDWLADAAQRSPEYSGLADVKCKCVRLAANLYVEVCELKVSLIQSARPFK